MKFDYIPFLSLLENIVDNRGRTCPTSDSGIPLIATNCVLNSHLYPAFEKIRHVDSETYKTWFRDHPKPGDMLFVTKGTPGRICWVPDPVNFCIAQDMVAIRANKKLVYPRFLFALLRSSTVQKMIENMHVGTLIPHFKKGDFDKLKLPIPTDYNFQKKIGNLYFDISEKIELNRQTNVTLEALAQSIFKEWFVDFKFPRATGEMIDSKLGMIPQGWNVGALGETANIKHGFAFKGEFFSEEETNDILLTPGNFRIGGGFNYSKFKYYNGEFPIEYILNQGDLIVTMTDLSKEGDTLGYSARVPTITGKRLLHNQRIGKVEVTQGGSWELYLYFVMQQKDYRDYVLSGATGTTVRHTSPTRICDYKMVLPSLDILQLFEHTVKPVIECIEHNYSQTATLAAVRDALLPKLMSGEISVDEVYQEDMT